MIMKWYLSFEKAIKEKPYSTWIILGVIITITWLVYSPATKYGFITNWDDNINVTQNKYISEFSYKSISTLFNKNEPIPEPRLVWFSYMIDYHFFKLNANGYHMHSLWWHLFNILIVFLLAQSLFKNRLSALLVATVFAFHPMSVEAVVWITGRKDLMFTAFYLLAMFVYIKWNSKSNHPFAFLIIIGLSYLSSLSKIQSITFPLSLILIDWYLNRDIKPMLLIEKIVIIWLLWINPSHLNFLTAIIIYPISYYLNAYVKSQKSNIYVTIGLLASFLIISTQVYDSFIVAISISLLIASNFFGRFQTQQYSIKISKRMLAIVGILFSASLIWFLLVSDTLMAYQFSRGLEFQKFGFIDRIFMAAYSLSHYIIKFFIPFGHSLIQPYPLKIDGLLPTSYYLSPLFLVFLFGFVFYFLKKKRDTFREIVFFILLFLIAISPVLHLIPIHGHLITADRYSYMSFFALSCLLIYLVNNVIKFKHSFLLFSIISLSFISIISIRIPLWKNEKVLFDQVIQKHPDFALAYNNRGFWYYNRGNLNEAEKDFVKAVEFDTSSKESFYNLSLIYVKQNNIFKAIETLNQIDTIETYVDGLYLRAYCLKKTEQLYAALQDFNTLIKLEPTHFYGLYNRGVIYYLMGDYRKSINDYKSALVIQPNFHQAYDAIGNSYLMSENYDSSLICYNKAISMESNIAEYYINKAECLIRMGKISEACLPLNEALKRNHPRASELLRTFCK